MTADDVDMGSPGVTLFDTAIGTCGVAWSGRGITGVQLPEASPRAVGERLRQRFPDVADATPPHSVREAIVAMVALLDGAPMDLSSVVLDAAGVPSFDWRVYEVTRAIPRGETLTYGQVAARLGDPAAARAVGRALGRNPFPIVVPCHRVVAAGGRPGGFSALGGVATKLRMLAIEDAAAAGPPRLFP